jgi:hypothetical protein
MPLSSMTVPIRIPWMVPGIIPGVVPRIEPGVIKVRVIGASVSVFFRPEIDFLGLNDRIYIATTT